MLQQETANRIFKIYPILLFFLVLTFIFSHFLYIIFSPVFIGSPKKIYLRPGLRGYEIAYILEKEGIIRSSFYFRLFANLKKSKLKAGYYDFYGKYNLLDVLKILEKGGTGIKIVIPEGKTLKEIEEIFRNYGFNFDFSKYKLKDVASPIILKYFDPQSSLEGFLAPDSYEFYKEDNEFKILKEILANFEKKFLPEIIKNTEITPEEILKLASIVEKEAKKEDDFPLIAGILLKRYKNNKLLQADATLVYEKCGFKFCNYELTKKDLNSDSPYNSYKKLGLPPTPISNPGIKAVRAVINPSLTDYWFYLTDKEGNAYYAKTYEEHRENIKKYLKK